MARPRSPARGPRLNRRLLVLSLAFGLFVLADLVLFGWLIFRSLSQREIEQVLLETRQEARTLAEQIAGRAEGSGDLYTAIASEQETQIYIDSIPRQREIVRSVKILDRKGTLVFQSQLDATEALGPDPGPILSNPEIQADGSVWRQTQAHEQEYAVPDIEVAIGDLGTLVIGLSQEELSQRIGVLRGHLIRKTSVVAVFTLGLLFAAYLAMWWLWRRGRRLEMQAAEAERMAYIGTLASGLAHEIRNPLNSLNLNMQMMQEEISSGAAEGPTAGRLLSITRDEISRLERLVTDFLAYARPRPPDLEPVTPAELFERVREVMAGALQRQRARLEVVDESDSAVLRVDVSQLTQLLLNLVQNALATAEDLVKPLRVTLRALRAGDEVALEVSDNGPGIPPEAQQRVFDIFYSTRKGGTGLGLAIVQRIAANHDGRVELESAFGEGATFRVWLPVGEGEGGGDG